MEKIVIIPALNPDETLREIVESNRKLGNLVIVVDDGSDENRRGLFEYLGEKCIVPVSYTHLSGGPSRHG